MKTLKPRLSTVKTYTVPVLEAKAGTTERIRGRKLIAQRKRLLRDNPLCVHCKAQGRVTLAQELDHIIALHNGGTNNDDNIQGLCIDHHKIKTAKDLGYKERHEYGLDGWPK